MSPALSLDNVSCTFLSRDDPSQRYTAVSDTTLIVGEGEFVSPTMSVVSLTAV